MYDLKLLYPSGPFLLERNGLNSVNTKSPIAMDLRARIGCTHPLKTQLSPNILLQNATCKLQMHLPSMTATVRNYQYCRSSLCFTSFQLLFPLHRVHLYLVLVILQRLAASAPAAGGGGGLACFCYPLYHACSSLSSIRSGQSKGETTVLAKYGSPSSDLHAPFLSQQELTKPS